MNDMSRNISLEHEKKLLTIQERVKTHRDRKKLLLENKELRPDVTLQSVTCNDMKRYGSFPSIIEFKRR